jgi:arginyl-tRNA synthetase
MLQAKQDLLAALSAGLDQLSPGAGARAAFELPKVAAHGDLACTAAMQLAKPLKRNPRQVAEALRDGLLATPAFQRWVDAVEIAGPGFLNIRLKNAAKQEVVREVLATGAGFGQQPLHGRRLLVEFVSANPTGPLHVGHGRQAALGDALSNLSPPRAGMCTPSSTTPTRAGRSRPWPSACRRAPAATSRATRSGPRPPTTATTSRTSPTTSWRVRR